MFDSLNVLSMLDTLAEFDWFAHEGQIRLTAFVSVFIILALWEILSPRRPLSVSKSLRWFNNLMLMLVNALALRFMLPVLAVGMALQAESLDWGLFNVLEWPFWLEGLLVILLLDLGIYWQHRLMHVVPILWRLHRMHHSDRDLDVSSAIRFHPLEILLSMLYKLLLITLLGPSFIAVIVFEVLLNALSLFTHANGYMPVQWDKRLRVVFVTPDMHRIHHSKYHRNETNSNYGVLTSLWDRLFKSYSHDPIEGQSGLTLGVEGFSSIKRAQHLTGLLITPFVDKEK